MCVCGLQDVDKKCAAIDADWETLQSDIAEILENYDDDDNWRAILERLSPLQSKLGEVQNSVEQKSTAHKMWLEHSESCAAAQENIARLEEKLADANLSSDQVSQLRAELEAAREQLGQLEQHEADMKEALAEADVVFKDRSTEEVVDARWAIETLLNKVADTGLQLGEKSDKLAHIAETRQQFDEVKETLTGDLEKLRDVVESAEITDLSADGIRDVIERLRSAQLQQSRNTPVHDRLHRVSQHLASVDPLSVNQSKTELGHIEADWQAVAALTAERLDCATTVAQRWEEYDDSKRTVDDTLKSVEAVLEAKKPCESLQELKTRVDMLKAS